MPVSLQKLMIIVLVVIVAVFVATIVMSASHPSGDTDRSSVVSVLKGLGGTHLLRIGDKATTTCAAGPGASDLTLSYGCSITLQKRGFLSSPTKVAFDAHGSFYIRTTPKSQPQQTALVKTDDCFGTAIDHGGGTLTFYPVPGATITLRDHACPSDDAGS
jgi:hypothetical protein